MALKQHIYYDNGRSKTVCTSAVLAAFGISPDRYHYSGTWGDVERILRRQGFAVRSRRSRLPKGCSVGQARKAIAKLKDPERTRYYVGVPGHAMLLDNTGATIVDTAPRKRDRRPVLRIYAVFPQS